ncbi:sensor histidine kinase [Marinoscillum pacificum]|uniref:sensor histidine kinase n=1 Tax=Marinoscillum pacificum TaxID=392723 RepID=UPI0021585BEE|nr:HAMP domain-containing sensor histidine kinase [Marinoscillum pacificum]
MMSSINNKLIAKLSLSFFLLLVVIGVAFTGLTVFITNKHFEEVTQRLNSQVAAHLINEKFQNESPFLEDGSVNKPLFGDLMHDMMAVNQGIEVYLLDDVGQVLYSVVLDHNPGKPVTQIDIEPINKFLHGNKTAYVLGDDPRNQDQKKIFSAESYDVNGKQGFIYIILAGQQYELVNSQLFSSFFLQLGAGVGALIIVFASLIGMVSIWFLTRNLREIIFQVKRFQDGDLNARIPNAETKDLSTLAVSFNEMADTIVKNLDEIKSVDALRRELIANISHDLRTPLAILQGYIETLEMKDQSLAEEERKKYLNIIWNSSERLSHMVSQLFEYSKLEAKQIEPHKEPFQITELAHDVRSKFEVLAKEKNISIHLEIRNNIPLVFADLSLVERVIQNLMDNALKFTPVDGTITLKITADNHEVAIAIVDTGEGISEADQIHIFDRYRKSESSSNKQGTGLGLAIAKKILEIHNSTIRVISQPNLGTTFQFGLPIYASPIA